MLENYLLKLTGITNNVLLCVVYLQFDGMVYQQIVGILMGTVTLKSDPVEK